MKMADDDELMLAAVRVRRNDEGELKKRRETPPGKWRLSIIGPWTGARRRICRGT
jgi:hypothetical protein